MFRERQRVSKKFTQPSRTVQASKDECDVNKILAKYRKNGLITHVSKFEGKYEDVSGAVDYQTALNVVMDSENMFMTLPSDIRAQFENDPGKFLRFVNNPDNGDKLIEMGLREAPIPQPGPVQVEVVNASPEAPK